MNTTKRAAVPPGITALSRPVACDHDEPGRCRAKAAVSPAAKPAPVTHGRRTLFSVAFASPMSDLDIARLARVLDLDTHLHPKLHNSPASPGVRRLDFDSGLFLLRGPEDGSWLLEGRAWGDPPRELVHKWHLRAAAAAHQLDPTVTVPLRSRAVAPSPDSATRPVGRAANKRLARIGRRLLRLESG